MITVGKWNDLTVLKKVDFGVYLGEKQEMKSSAARSAHFKEAEEGVTRILLPEKQVPAGTGEGDVLHVFIYRDSEDRMIATVREPALTLGGIAELTVKEVTKIGAFLDWGLEKDLFLPYKEQTKKVQAGERVLAALYTDKSGRLCATMNVYPYLLKRSPHREGQIVQGTAYESSDNFGLFVAVDDKYSALLPRREAAGSGIEIGQKVTARVSRVKKDGRLELTLHEKAYKQRVSDAEMIEEIIRKDFDGTLPFDDKADPEQIREVFNMSKAAFKRAVGALYKERKIEFGEESIHLK